MKRAIWKELRRAGWRRFGLGAAAFLVSLMGPAIPATLAKSPNVLFIALDDLNDWIGCLGGHPQTLTPNLDRLAASGVLFTNAHCPGAACNPSRTAIMTGRSPHRSGLYENGQKMREILPDAKLLPRYFADHGYWAGGSGKILHYFIDARSWDEYFPAKETEDPFPRTLYPEKRPVNLPRGGPWQYVETDWAALDATDEEFGGDWLVAEWVGKKLRQSWDKPFFLACGIYRPHEPWFVPKKYFEPFPLDEIELPPGYKEDDLEDLPPEGKRRGPNRYFAHIREHGQWKQGIQGYLASIHFADAMLGRVLDALEQGPNADDTIVVLWSDHGWHLGEKQHWQKFTAWRDVSRVPLMVRVPEGTPGLPEGTRAGTVCDKPVDLLSLFPTLTGLAGLPKKEDNDGFSLIPLLREPESEWPHVALTHLGEPGSFGLSAEGWRYIRYAGGGEELYHIDRDPHEWTNLASHPESAPKLEELRAASPKEFAPRVEPSDDALPRLTFQPAGPGAAPPSRPDGNSFDVTFRNDRGAAVELFWSDRNGKLKPYGQIAPKGKKRQRTRPGAVWVVRDNNGEPLGYFTVGDRRALAVIPASLAQVLPDKHIRWNPGGAQDCPPSKQGGGKTELVLRNNRTNRVKVYWIDGAGKRAQEYGVKGGGFLNLKTFTGHSWLVTDANDQVLGYAVAPARSAVLDIPAIQVPNPGAGQSPALRPITPPAPELELDPFYEKCINLDGYLILSSGKVSDFALREAAYLVGMMLQKRPDVLKALAASGSRLTVMAYNEYTTDVPEHASVPSGDRSKNWWDRRARGLGGSESDPVASCAEENLLCFPGDPYSKENILIHEFAHAMHLRGLNRIDATFDERLEKTWKKAMDAGLWKGKYPSVNHHEYFAEGVQSWFNNNRENDHDHNHVDTRAELKEYDPGLAAICEEVFGDTELTYIRPPERKDQAHLEGYDYAMSPEFRWPKHLKILDVKRKPASAQKKKAEGKKPNVLFLAIDDLRPELGCYGADHIHSPHIDRLAASGVRFDRAYCQVAVCNPSRVSLLTGLRPDSSRVWTLDVRFRDTVPEVVTLPGHFKEQGYTAIGFGKVFHNPWPDNQSWSEPHAWPEKSSLWSEDAKGRHRAFREQMRADGKSEAAIRRMRAPAVEIVDVPDREHIDGAIAQQAIQAMRHLAGSEKPFFLAAGFIRPHLPFVVPRKYWELYDREEISLAENHKQPRGAPEFAMNTMYELRDYMDYAATPSPQTGVLTSDQQRELRHGYYASVSLIDAQVGLLLEELENLGLADDTVVVLWSDHGWKLGEHGSWCKQTNYEVDARVPLIIRDPRAKGNGGVSQALVELVDLYPTLCDLADIAPRKGLEGVSLRPLLENPEEKVKEAAFSQFRRRHGNQDLMGYSMRTERFRYVEWVDRRSGKAVDYELYDHGVDAQESENLADRPEQRKQRDELSRKLWSLLPRPPKLSEEEKQGKSIAKRPVFRFRNERSEPVVVYWLPEGRPPRKVGEMAPGGGLIQNTTKGHRFRVQGRKSGFRNEFTVRREEETVTLAPEDPVGKEGGDAKLERPNVVVVMADDWSWPHAGILGDPAVRTPHFDRIAREGVLFENAFASAPSCTPSRFAVVTGQYHWRLGEGDSLGGSLRADVPVYPDLLADAGYVTGYSRKGASPSRHQYRGNDPFGPRFKDFEEFLEQRQPGMPFCYWYGAGEPHRPYDWKQSLESDLKQNEFVVPGCLPDHETVRTDLGDYYLRVEKLDQLAGKILAMLEASGELENTLFVMTSDNGMPFPRCKATLYDLGTRVPLAMRWGKQIQGGHTIRDFVHLTDLAPTFLEAAGVAIPEVVTGRSLLPQLNAGRSGWVDEKRNYVLTGMERHVYPNPARAIRTEDHLYIRNFSPRSWPTGEAKRAATIDFQATPWPTFPGAFSHNVDPSPTKQWMLASGETADAVKQLNELAFGLRLEEELYDLKADPDQLVNLAGEAGFAEVRKRLSHHLSESLRTSGDPRYALTNHATFPVRGWTVHLHDQLWAEEGEKTKLMLGLLAEQLKRVEAAVPSDALNSLRKVPLWINPPYPGKRPSAEYHPEVGWLKQNGRDPRMVKAVEFTNASNFGFEDRRMPYLLLHELAHAYHDQVLNFDHAAIKSAYEKAQASGGYERVQRFNGKSMVFDKAYAMSNHKEYFAELTEAYFGKNDFFPFDAVELKEHDPEMHDLLGSLWGVN